ncbi:MAG: hypothetical protein WD768_15725 [Phycisphaeraceae bacterium]
MPNKELKLDDDVDLVIGPLPPLTDEDRAEISRALAENRQRPGYAEAVKELHQTIERIERAAPPPGDPRRKQANALHPIHKHRPNPQRQ